MYKDRISFLALSKLLIWLLMVGLLVDIGGGFGLKYFILILFVGFFLIKSFKRNFPRSTFFEISVCVFFFSAALFSIIRGSDVGAAFSEISFLVFVSVFFVGTGVGAKFIEYVFLRITLLASLVVIATFVLIVIFPEIGVASTSFAKENRLGYIGLKSLDGGVPNIYFRWSIWLILGFSLSLFARKHSLSIIVLVAAVMTLSTAIIGGIFLVTFSYFLLSYKFGAIRIFEGFFLVLIFFVPLVLVSYLFPDAYQVIFSKFSTNSASTSIKIGHIESILNLLTENPAYLIYGQGPGSYFYSVGVNEVVTNVEVSHFNLLRQFGVLGWLVYFLYSFYVVGCLFSLGRQGYPWAIGLTMMFFVAGTNPLLLSPIFFVPLMLGRLYSSEFFKAIKYERAKNRSSDVYL